MHASLHAHTHTEQTLLLYQYCTIVLYTGIVRVHGIYHYYKAAKLCSACKGGVHRACMQNFCYSTSAAAAAAVVV